MSEPEPILGLDLGTSTCPACVVYGGRTSTVRPDLAYSGRGRDQPDFPGELMPSAFGVVDGVPRVGERALVELTDPAHARDVVREVKREMHRDDKHRYRVGGREYSPSEITAEHVKVLIRAAAAELGISTAAFKKAVVTVPADFVATAQEATSKACVAAGLSPDGVGLVDEPVAALYSLGLHDRPGRRRVLIIDLGGGTFDVALWDVGRDAGPMGFDELGRGGDTRLGGLDWDREIASYTPLAIRPELPRKVYDRLMEAGNDPGHNNLFRASEHAKSILSRDMKRHAMADQARPLDLRRLGALSVAFRPSADRGEVEHVAEMSAEMFLRKTARLLDRCVEVCHGLFDDIKTIEKRADFGWAELDCVYLAGGGSRLPTVQRRFAECWGRLPTLAADPQHAVVKGAAMIGDLWSRGQFLPSVFGKTRYERSIGLLVKAREPGRDRKFYPIIPRNKQIPFRMTEPFPVTGGSHLRSLRLLFAERQFPIDGPSDVKIDELNIPDLPPPIGPGPEQALVTVDCDAKGSPSFHIAFRGMVASEDLKNLPRAAGRPPSRDGSGPPTIPPGRDPSGRDGGASPLEWSLGDD